MHIILNYRSLKPDTSESPTVKVVSLSHYFNMAGSSFKILGVATKSEDNIYWPS